MIFPQGWSTAARVRVWLFLDPTLNALVLPSTIPLIRSQLAIAHKSIFFLRSFLKYARDTLGVMEGEATRPSGYAALRLMNRQILIDI